MLSWEEVRSEFDRCYRNQVADDVLTDQLIDSYQQLWLTFMIAGLE